MSADASVLHESFGQRVRFGAGTAAQDVAEEAERLGARRVLLVAAEAELDVARRVCAGVPVVEEYSGVRPHVPLPVAEAARAAATSSTADLLVCVGGGSTTGAAKAVALTTGLPVLAVPTTYAGSEATPVWGLTTDGRKTTGVDPVVLPRVVVYDAQLTLTLPVGLSVTSGLNALAHCVDSWWAPRRNPISSALAGEGVRTLVAGLRRVVVDPGDVDARRDLQTGTYVAAVAFAGAGSGLHHKVCHVLGGTWDLEHAAVHAVVLPHVAGLLLPASPDAARRLGQALDDPADPFGALVEVYRGLPAPRDLGSLGLPAEDVERAAELVLGGLPAALPRPVTRELLVPLLDRARAGDDPELVVLDWGAHDPEHPRRSRR